MILINAYNKVLLWPYFIENGDIAATEQCGLSLGKSFTLTMADLIPND
jgi:hypothetical protein